MTTRNIVKMIAAVTVVTLVTALSAGSGWARAATIGEELESVAELGSGPAAIAVDDDEKKKEKKKKKKKKKKQRGKVVRATMVTSTPEPTPEPVEPEAAPAALAKAEPAPAPPESEPESEPEPEPAAAPAEVAEAESTAPTAPAVEPRPAPEPAAPVVAATPEPARAEPEPTATAVAEAPEPARSEPEPAPRQVESAPVPTAPVPTAPVRTEPVVTAAPEPVAAPKPTTRSAEPTPVPSEPAAAAVAAVADPVDPPREAPQRRGVDTFAESLLVREVLIDVLVTDSKGNVVEGLTPDDFIVTEEGDERRVTSLSFYGNPAELTGSGVSGDTRSDRYFLFLFHDQAQAEPSLMAAQLDAGRWAKKWAENEMLPNDQVAVLGYDVRLKLYQDFTRDSELVAAAIDLAARGRKEPDRWTTRSAPEIDPNSPSLAINMPTGKALAKQTRRLQQALELIGTSAEGIVGRKNLMLFSMGFGEILQFGMYTPDPRFYPPMMQALNTGNVAVYAIDLVGSRRGSPSSRLLNDSLSGIANDTGGHYYSTFTNPLTPIRQVSEDNLGYYLLSYQSEYEAGSSGYREIKVDTRDKKLKVRYRRGYRYGGGS